MTPSDWLLVTWRVRNLSLAADDGAVPPVAVPGRDDVSTTLRLLFEKGSIGRGRCTVDVEHSCAETCVLHPTVLPPLGEDAGRTLQFGISGTAARLGAFHVRGGEELLHPW